MSIGNLKDQGNKGNNFPYQRAVLELLSNISTSTGAPCCPTAATEITLQQVLQALQGGAGIFNTLVIDTAGAGCPANCPTYSEVRVWDPLTSTFTTTYYDANGVQVFPVPGSLVYVNPQFVLNNILLQLTSVTRTPGMIRTSAVALVTIPANTYRSISFRNAGSTNATVLGANLLPGESISFDAGSLKDLLGAITYNANGTDLLITTIA